MHGVAPPAPRPAPGSRADDAADRGVPEPGRQPGRRPAAGVDRRPSSARSAASRPPTAGGAPCSGGSTSCSCRRDRPRRPAGHAVPTPARSESLEREARAAVATTRGGVRWLDEHPEVGEGWADAVTARKRARGRAHRHRRSPDVELVVGYLVLDVDGPIAHVDQVYVTPEARQLGFGDALLELATETARQSGAAYLEGHALPGDRETKNLYERAGITARSDHGVAGRSAALPHRRTLLDERRETLLEVLRTHHTRSSPRRSSASASRRPRRRRRARLPGSPRRRAGRTGVIWSARRRASASASPGSTSRDTSPSA